MANYAKKEAEREALHRAAEDDGFLPRRRPPPLCHCGAPAKIHVSLRNEDQFLCLDHEGEAKL